MQLRSLRARLSVLFFGVTLVAVGVMFFYVTPQLESSLREQKFRSIARTARDFKPQIASAVEREDTARQLNQIVGQIGDATSTRVTLLTVGGGTLGIQPRAILSDSTAEVRQDDLRYAVAVDAARSGREAQGSEYRGSVLLGQVAEPIRTGGRVSHVVVFMSPLSEVQGNVALIRRQILIAGGLGLLLALGGGFAVSNAIARRVKLLEQGAERVAGGDFTAVFPAGADDELGQLARALDDMQRQLAEVETARRRFIATASHELRTPIFSLGGFLELLEDEELDDDTRREFVAVVREQVARLGKLATDLLDLSRLEAGSLELRPEPTDLGDLTNRVTLEFAPALVKHESELALRVEGESIETVCDPERVAQILRILLDNALTHTPSGTGVVVTAARRNGAVALGVCDDGPGLRPDVAARVFEPFFTSDDAQGSGLGLAIARELAERMDGSLDVDSVPGRTTFSLELPA
ncbi:MAG: HAMP domain-containing sensor histidine kinase [Solirubrobacteraceae bacterium]